MRLWPIVLAVSLCAGVARAEASDRVLDPVELRRIRAVYRREIGVVETQYRTNLEKAPSRHIGNLRILENRFLDAGALTPFREVEKERERFTADSSTESMKLVDSPQALRDLQVMYLKGYHEMKAERARAIVDLTRSYLRRLGKLQEDLTRERRLREAEKVLAEREKTADSGLLKDAQAILTGDQPVLPDVPIEEPKQPSTAATTLEERIGGTVAGWNPHTKELTVEYDFSTPEQFKDWQGGASLEMVARMRCAGETATLRIPFLKVSRVIFEGRLREDEGSIRMTLGSRLTAEIGAGRKRNDILLYQDEKFPIAQARREVFKIVPYLSTMEIKMGEVHWTVNDRVMKSARLRKPLLAPLTLGLGHADNETEYDSVLIQGIVDPEEVMNALASD